MAVRGSPGDQEDSLTRPDKAWSVTDCTSFEDMREHGISDALTADHHFEQAGFEALLK